MSIAARRIDAAQSVKDEGNYLRRIIRRNKGKVLTNSEIKVLMALVNLWIYHRNGPKGFIHPGREALAKKAGGISVITVARSLDKLRGLGIAIPIKNLKGGNGRATQYRISTQAIQRIFAPSNVTVKAGELHEFSVSFERQNDTQQPYQNDTLSIGMETPSPGKVSTDVPTMNPFADIGDGNLLRKDRARPEASASLSKPATSAMKKTNMKGSAT